MDKQKWTERKWVKRAGWVALVLWIAGSSILLFGRSLIPVVVGLGAFYLAGGLVVSLIWLIYKLGGGRRKHLPDLAEVGVVVILAGAIGLLITAIQERVIKFLASSATPFSSATSLLLSFFSCGAGPQRRMMRRRKMMIDLVRELTEVLKEKAISPEAAARFIGVSGREVRRWVKEGHPSPASSGRRSGEGSRRSGGNSNDSLA